LTVGLLLLSVVKIVTSGMSNSGTTWCSSHST